MVIGAASSLSPLPTQGSIVGQGGSAGAGVPPSGQGFSFREVFGGRGEDLFQKVAALEGEVLRGREIHPRELLSYQITVGRFNMQVEMVAKATEALAGTVRRLQGS